MNLKRFLITAATVMVVLGFVVPASDTATASRPSSPSLPARLAMPFVNTAFAQGTAPLRVEFTQPPNPTVASQSQSIQLTARMIRTLSTITGDINCRFTYLPDGASGSPRPMGSNNGIVACNAPSPTTNTWDESTTWSGVNFEGASRVMVTVTLVRSDGSPRCTELTQELCTRFIFIQNSATPSTQPTVTISYTPSSQIVPPNTQYVIVANLQMPAGDARTASEWRWENPAAGAMGAATLSCSNEALRSTCTFRAPTAPGQYGRGSVEAWAGSTRLVRLTPLSITVQTELPIPTVGIATGPDCGCDSSPLAALVGSGLIQYAICQATCAVSIALGSVVGWIAEQLINVSGVTVEPGFINRISHFCVLTLFG